MDPLSLANDETQSKPLVLVVDDQPENRELLEELLTTAGYEVAEAADGVAALEAIEQRPPDVILLDIMMPRMDGYEVARRLRATRKTAFIPIVMLTALSDLASKVRGLEAGADDFLNKPFRRDELLARIRSLVRIRRLRDELDTSENIIFAMVAALESKEPRTAGHSYRVAARANLLARRLHVEGGELEALVRGAMLHDIGKIGIPEEILEARAGLDREQQKVFLTHTWIGEQILSPLVSLRPERDIIRGHHERLDGSGYPDGLSGLAFSLPLEIACVSNFFDDLIYHQGMDTVGAAEALRADADAGKFHRDVVEDFLIVASEHLPPPTGDFDELLPPPQAPRSGKILVADDTTTNREILEAILGEAGLDVECVDGGNALLARLEEGLPDLVLADVRMPDIGGFELCRRIKSLPATEMLPVVLLTAHSEIGDRERSAELGADDFLTTPLNRTELIARVRSLLRMSLYRRDLEEHQSVILSLATALEAKDPYTRGHSARVGELAARLAEELGMTVRECEQMRVAGLLHDIGKVGVPARLLNKPGQLTVPEFKTIMTHPVRGAQICSSLRSVRAVLPYIRHHHERFDGGGYPDGLKGDQIPLGARVLALADAFDALTSRRSYRQPLEADGALALLETEMQGGKWDPRIFGAMALMVRAGKAVLA
jgi:putative two-component system response regulator